MNFDNKDEIFVQAIRFHKVNNFDMCIKILKKIHKYYPNDIKVLYYISRTYLDKKEYPKAITYYSKLLTLNNSHLQAKFDLAYILLLKRELLCGFEKFECRLEFPEYKKVLENKYPTNIKELRGKKVFIYTEQGYGDSLHFIRYIKYVELYTQSIEVLVQKPLYKLFKKNFQNVKLLTKHNGHKSDYDYIFPLLSLPFILGLDCFEPLKKYLFVKKKSIKKSTSFINIGLCWQGESKNKRDRFRSFNIELFMSKIKELKLKSKKNFRFFSLQKDIRVENKLIKDLGVEFSNFYDTSIAIKSMDLVITVDTSVCHLAGALGIKTYLLLPYYSDWRWQNKKKKSDLYKSIKIFRQVKHVSWEEPLEKVVRKLKRLKY